MRSRALSILIGLFARLDDDPPQAAADAVSGYGLGILVPLATLWLGTSAIGDLVEDKLLVYLSLKPVPRGSFLRRPSSPRPASSSR